MATAVWIVRISGARRDIVVDDGSAMRREAFGKRRHSERIAADRALVAEEVGAADIVRHQHAILEQRHRVALQRVACRMAARGEGRGHHPGGRWKGGTIGREAFGACGELGKDWRSCGIDEIAP